MSKRELIDAIRQHNRTAAPEFLAHFAETDLRAYLDRMLAILSPDPTKCALNAAVRTTLAA